MIDTVNTNNSQINQPISESFSSVLKKQFNKVQANTIIKTIVIAAVGFMAICALGYGFGEILKQTSFSNQNWYYGISGGMFLITMIVMIVFSFSRKQNYWTISIMYLLYIVTMGFGFASIFYIFNNLEILFIFGIAGIVLVLTAIVGFTIKDRTMITLSRIVQIVFIFYILGVLVFSLLSIYVWNLDWVNIIITCAGSFLAVAFCIFSFNRILKTSVFSSNVDDKKMINLMCFYNAFDLLTSIVYAIFIIARLMLFSRS